VTSIAARDEVSLRAPLLWSAALHLLAAAAFLVARAPARVPMPPTYRVTLIAAPAGPRQVGVVRETPPAPSPTPTPPAPAPVVRATPEPDRMKAPAKVPPARAPTVATPSVGPAKTAPRAAPRPDAAPAKTDDAARAGGGPTGGRGADVANVRTEGIEFPYPVYLQNVVRQIALQFRPSTTGALRAEVAFLIRRDGSVTGLKLATRSGSFSFDQDAMGAVEAASRANAFGPLPAGFTDDVLPVIFSFDPRLIR
jgi:outer membrane biosynthesis protein TonB